MVGSLLWNVDANGESCHPWRHEHPHRCPRTAQNLVHRSTQDIVAPKSVHRKLAQGVGRSWLAKMKAEREAGIEAPWELG